VNRKWVVALADLGAGLTTAGLLALYLMGRLEIWHLYLSGAISNAFGAFQEPAVSASVSTLVTPQQLTRANGMLSLAYDGSHMFAPMLAGALLAPLGVSGIMTIDLTTCLAAVLVVSAMRISRPVESAAGKAARGLLRHELSFGFRDITRHPGLLGILLILTVVNLFAAITYFGVLPAMVLSRSQGNEVALGAVQSMLGIGGVVGGVLLSLWGGPKDRVKGFSSTALTFLPRYPLRRQANAAGLAGGAFVSACSSLRHPGLLREVIWQSSVPDDIRALFSPRIWSRSASCRWAPARRWLDGASSRPWRPAAVGRYVWLVAGHRSRRWHGPDVRLHLPAGDRDRRDRLVHSPIRRLETV
jgi:hypothetical protein